MKGGKQPYQWKPGGTYGFIAPNGPYRYALAGEMYNLGLKVETTTDTDDTLTVTGADGTALSAANPGWITLPDAVNGRLKHFKVTADVSLVIEGCTWGNGADLTDAVLDIIALNNNGSLVWGVSYYCGSARGIILDTLDDATAANVTLPEEVFVNSALSADAQAVPAFWVKADFDFTGGDSELQWTFQKADGDLNHGSSDGIWRPWNTVFTGFSSDPTASTSRWTMIGNTAWINWTVSGSGTSNATSFTMTLPVKANAAGSVPAIPASDNSAIIVGASGLLAAGSNVLSMRDETNSTTGWTASNNKRADVNFAYEAL